MTLNINQLTKDISNVDIADILSCWRWKIEDMKGLVAISVLGDMFLLGHDEAVYWLQTDCGDLSKAAEDLSQFKELLTNSEQVDIWFLPSLVEKLITAGMTLEENEVYSYKKLPAIGGEYAENNIVPTDMSVHFAFTGQICEQIKDLPEGTKVNIKFKRKR